MTAMPKHKTYAYQGWRLNWSLRSTIAVGVGAIMALASAYGSTLTVERERRIIRAELEQADQVQLLADYTAFIAQETARNKSGQCGWAFPLQNEFYYDCT